MTRRPGGLGELAEAGAKLLGLELDGVTALAGGDLSQIAAIVLADGSRAVVKGGPTARREARMLAAIAASGAPAPRVLAVDGDVLVIERLQADGSVGSAWASLGSVLGELHAAEGGRYGWHEDHAFGPVDIVNTWDDGWPGFWAEHRLLVNVPHIDASLARRIEALAHDAGNRLPAQPAASLLHGDLWGGNVLVADRRVSGLIDPACYYGHAEVDLAMLSLFDHPSAEFFASYRPLEAGHESRLPIYQLWPALVHLRLFGRGYAPLVERLLGAAGV
jgi:fructosamine-3-kinase